jgi:hypothetical protein
MERKREEEPKQGETREEIEKQAEKSRRELDEIPPPGTDPLHEGP